VSAAIEFDNVSVRFGDLTALDQVTVSIPSGAFVALVGPNGGGKTTLLHLAAGLRRPDRGTVSVLGGAPGTVDAMRIAYVPQAKRIDPHVPAQAMELVATGLKPRWPWSLRTVEAEALKAMAVAGIEHRARHRVGALSGGELQRVYLARALARKPEVLLLDEPAAGIDLVGEAEMYHTLMQYQRGSGCTIFMITHDWEGARAHASHALLLNKTLRAFGPAKETANESMLLSLFGHTGHIEATHHDD